MNRYLLVFAFMSFYIPAFGQDEHQAVTPTIDNGSQRLAKKCTQWGEEAGLSGNDLKTFIAECIDEANGSGEG